MSLYNENNLDKVLINWFPGHMAKAKREVSEKLKLVDLVIELKDARIPNSSTNPMVDELIGNKNRLIILCKSSYADNNLTKKFIDYYNSKNILALDVDLITNHNVSLIKKYIIKASSDILEKRKLKGIINEEIRIMVLGIPNVGKSTFINKITNKSSLKVGNKPGVTKSTNVWLKLDNKFLLLDTPGILWPKFNDVNTAYNLAITGGIKEEVLPLDEVIYYAIDYINKYYKELLISKYKINEETCDILNIINQIAINRGCIKKGNLIDYNKVYKLIYNDLKNAKLGCITYDRI